LYTIIQRSIRGIISSPFGITLYSTDLLDAWIGIRFSLVASANLAFLIPFPGSRSDLALARYKGLE